MYLIFLQQIGNEYAMNYSYGSVEPEPWHDYPVLGSQPSLQVSL